jgi:hypothetical protein
MHVCTARQAAIIPNLKHWKSTLGSARVKTPKIAPAAASDCLLSSGIANPQLPTR